MPFKESYTQDYVLDPESNNSQFPYYIGIMKSLELHTTIPENKADIMSWKNLINNYYGLLIEADHYIYEIFLLLQKTNMLSTTSVTIISDHGEMLSAHGLKQKGFPFENSCNISCLIYSPYIPQNLRGIKSNVLGSLLDIAPTIEVLANIKQSNRSTNFLGESLLNWDRNYLIPRTDDIPVFNIYNSWMSYLTYFNYKSWYQSTPDNTVLTDFNPTNFFKYQAFFTMIVTNYEGKKYKMARYFNYIELLEYNWLFNDTLTSLSTTITAIEIISNFNQQLNNIPMFENSIDYAKVILNNYFTSPEFIADGWNFTDYYNFIVANTTPNDNDNFILVILLLPIINITTANIGFTYIMPGYYNSSYTIFNTFLDYYNDPDHNYYFFMYNVTDDPNELTNLLDKGYPARQTTEVLAIASILNDNLNLLLEKYEIVNFDFIVPTPIFVSLAINLKIHGNGEIASDNVPKFESCFGLNRIDGDKKTQPYYIQTLDMLENINLDKFDP